MGAPQEEIAAFAAQQAAKQQDTVKSFAFGQGQTISQAAEPVTSAVTADTSATATATAETEGGSAD
jgi:hypothetical protein